MFNNTYELIKKYDTIVLARHVGVDPDAMCSQIALRNAIRLTFPDKRVLATGTSTAKFTYIGKLDKLENIDYKNTLLIITDTPDKKRVDIENIDEYGYKIKIDHHPYIETFCNLEIIDDKSSSASQLVAEMLYETPLEKNEEIMGILFQGIVSDTNRFMFANSNAKTFELISKMINEYHLDITKLYESLYLRPLKEVKFQGYIEQNLTVTEHGVAYIKITDDIINKYKTDASAAGNMINNLNYIEEVIVWLTISEDLKNDILKVSIRSRGPEINKIAEKYNGGGHKMASGARVKTFEEVEFLINDLDKVCSEYLKKDDVQ